MQNYVVAVKKGNSLIRNAPKCNKMSHWRNKILMFGRREGEKDQD